MVWDGAETPWFAPKFGILNHIIFGTRLIIAVLMTLILLLPMLTMLGVEALTKRRDLSPQITAIWARLWLYIAGIRLEIHGTPMKAAGAVVSNHVSWPEINILQATTGGYLVSKAEIAKWPVVGFLGRITRVEFIERKARSTKEQNARFATRLGQGDRLVFFPEGTTSDGLRVLPFRSSLFAAFVDADIPNLKVQPVSIIYPQVEGASEHFFGLFGPEKTLAAHGKAVLSLLQPHKVIVVFHPPIDVGDDRKALARAAETAVRDGLYRHLEPERQRA